MIKIQDYRQKPSGKKRKGWQFVVWKDPILWNSLEQILMQSTLKKGDKPPGSTSETDIRGGHVANQPYVLSVRWIEKDLSSRTAKEWL